LTIDRFCSTNYPTQLQAPPKVKYGKLYAAKLIQQNQRVGELRKIWSTYSSSIKKTASLNRREARKTGGGGPPEQLTALQDKVVGICRGLEGSHISIKNITTLIFHKNIQLWQIVLFDTLCILKLS
jgi:hypothetical protein